MTCDAHTLTNYNTIINAVSELMPHDSEGVSRLWNESHKNAITAELHTAPAIFAGFVSAIETVAGAEFVRETATLGGRCIERVYTLCGVTVCAQLCLGF